MTAGFAESVKQRREIKSAQLDAVIRGSLADAEAGVPSAASVVIAAVAAQTKLYGLAAAEKLDINAAITLSFDAHTELLGRLEKLAGPPKTEPTE